MPQISSELKSQTMSKNVIKTVLHFLERTKWEDNYNVHDLHIEAWDTGVWIKEAGIISYKDLATILVNEARAKAHQLPVQKRGENLFLVGSFQDNKLKYCVVKRDGSYVCNCMKYKCWKNRMQKECPKLYKALEEDIFCHHGLAVALN